MRNRVLTSLLISLLLICACTPAPPTAASAAGACPELIKVAQAFYEANDAAQLVNSLAYFTEDVIMLTFHLTPDRAHADGRPYDPYVVEMVFSGCRIEMLKIVERITWL